MYTAIIKFPTPTDNISINTNNFGKWEIFYKRKLTNGKLQVFEVNFPFLPNSQNIAISPKGANVTIIPNPKILTEIFNYPPQEQLDSIAPTKVIYSEDDRYKHTPACTYPKLGIIIVNKYFKSLPHYKQLFIYLHELAHALYKTEHFCDTFACIEMLKKGYNYTQVIQAMTEVLTDSEVARFRVNYVFEKIKEYNKYLTEKK
jgi:hypothetical protein